MSEEIKKQLADIAEKIQGLAISRATCSRLISSGSIKIVDANDKNEEPLSINVTGEIISAVLNPVTEFINLQKEQLLNAKESLLLNLEKGLAEETEKGPGKDSKKEIEKKK